MERNSCPAWSVWSQLRCQRRRSSSVSFYTVLKVSPKRLWWLWSTFGLDPSSDTLLIFRKYDFQTSSLRELYKEYNKYHLKYHGSKGLVSSSSSSFFPKRIWAAERRGQVTPSNSTDQGPSPKRLRQLQKVFSISLRKSVPNIIIMPDDAIICKGMFLCQFL